MLDPVVLKTYRNRLTNLTGRNRSLLLTTLPAQQFLDLHETDFLLNKPAFDLITQLLSRRSTLPVCEVMDPRNERVNEVSKRLRRIARTAQFIEAERGTEDLYVGWPFVRGKFMDGTVVHGPLLFFPVNIAQTGNRWQLTRRGADRADSRTADTPTVLLNTAFALAYSHFNQVKIGDDILEKDFADFDKDLLIFRTQLYEWLKTTPLEINFNPALFADTLIPFDRQPTKSLDTLEHVGELKLYPEAVLGIFPQAGSYLVPDYDALLERTGTDADDFFPTPIGMPEPATSPRLIREEHLHTPLPLDASQEAALRAVKAGESVVVQGPPGTGKSQLIANLMADAAAGGKRVLLVCQKRAALDVVYNRLCEVGMGRFVALIHDFQNDRPALYGQVAGQVADVDDYKRQNTSLDTVVLERNFDTESRRIDQLVGELQAFKDALFDSSSCGLSVKELYLSAVPETDRTVLPAIDLSAVYEQFHFDQLDGFLNKLGDYAAYRQRLGSAHPFADRVSFSSFGALVLSAAERIIATIPETATLISTRTTPFFGRPPTLTTLATWYDNAWPLTSLLTLADGPDAETRWQLARSLLMNSTHPARLVDEAQLMRLADTWETILASPGPETSLQPAELPGFQTILNSALAARGSWVSWNWWQLTQSGKATLMRVLTTNALSASETDLQTLAERVEKRVQLEALRRETDPLLTLSPVLPCIPASLRLLRQAREVAERLSHLAPLLTFLPTIWETLDGFANAVRQTTTLADTVQQNRADWQTYLTEGQIERAWTEPTHAQTLQRALRTDFDVLVETDQLTDSFSELEITTIRQFDGLPPTQWVRAFRQTLCGHWIDHIEQQYPILRSVSSLKMEQMERALQDSMAQKQALSRNILLVKLREQTYQNLTVNRLNNLVSYRDLQHQATKKRSIWPVRKLMSQFADEVFKLVPCWLASPESVSAMFPLIEGLFDLVIFDEASQCFAESGIPAMARGKQIVVAGDSQQLRPSDLYRIRLDTESSTDAADESDAAPDRTAQLEVESLLELAAQTLPQVTLTGHYRSRSPELIAFSNAHFYGNKLTLLPDFTALSQPADAAQPGNTPAIHYHNVKGVWQQNTNPVEAEAVLELIEQLATERPDRSIGVVTFNYQQQQLIQELLENQTDTPRSGPATGEMTFVKNIENVQGDERDIIIFSIGYAADERGRLAMQFGSLNGRGGENRLNVAVTRARERIYVVTSLWPEQLNVEQSVNAGPKLLKAYLAYALDVAQGRFRPQPRPVAGLRSSALLKTRLTAQHPDWRPALPFADLTELKNDHYQSLILTDDDLYFQQTPKETHAYLPFALRDRHWPFQRIWSREFWRGEGLNL